MVAHGGGESFSCPECGEDVGDSLDQCPKCNTPIERKSDSAEDDTRGESPTCSEVRSSPEFQDAVQSLESSEETLRVEGVQGTFRETSMTNTNEESNIGEQPDRKTDDLCVSATCTDSRQTLETCNTASVPASDEESKQSSEEHSGCSASGAGDPVNDSEDFSIIDHVDPKHFRESADMSDVISEEDIFADAKDRHDEVDSKNDSSDSGSTPTWEMVDHDEVVTPPGDCDQNVVRKSDVLLDSEIEAIGEVRSDQDEAVIGQGVDESDAIGKVKSDQDGAAVGHGVDEHGNVPTPVEKQPEGDGEDTATSEYQAHLPMDISDSEGNLSDGTQLERRFSGLHVKMADSPGSSGDGDTDGQLHSAEDIHVTQTSDGQTDEDVVMVGETQSRSSSVDYGITESNDSASNHSSEERLEGSVPVVPPQEKEQAPPIDDMPVESIGTDQSIEPFDSLYHQTLSLTWDTSDLFCRGNIPPPLCDGYDSDSKDVCKEPISEGKCCSSCGQKNKFVSCKKPHDDGSPCMLFIKRDGPCPCCEAAELAKAAKAESIKEAVSVPDNIDLMCHSNIPPPNCDGYDSDEGQVCNEPISEKKCCANCGQKNKYVRCRKSHDDGTSCMLFVRKGELCPCCEAAKAAKALPPNPPVCDGVDDEGNSCQAPIGPGKFCPECATRNKYVQCRGQNGDGFLCKWFVLQGKKCPICQTVVVAPRPKSKKSDHQVKVKPQAKETELRAMPANKRARTEPPSPKSPRRSLGKEVQPGSMDLGHTDQSGDTFSHLSGNEERKQQDRGMPSLDSKSSVDANFGESYLDHSASGEQGDGDRRKFSHSDFGNQSSYHEPREKMISDESTPEEEQCKLNESISKDGAINEEKLLGSRATRESSERPSDKDQKSSDHANAGIFTTNMTVALYERPDEIGKTGNPSADKVFGTSQDNGPQGGAVDDHPLAHGIDGENGNDVGASASRDDSAVNLDDEMETSSDARRKRELQDSHESTSEVGGKKSKDSAAGGIWYQKKDIPPEGYNLRSHDKNKKTKGAENTAVQKKPTQLRKMRFHVVVHRHFKFDDRTDEIIIRFGHHYLGGWNDNENRHKMKLVQKYDKGYALMELEVVIPDNMYSCEYKYAFIRHSKKKFTWEYLPAYSTMTNRKFRVDNSQNKQTELHQYDGLMYPPPDDGGFWTQVKKGFKKTFGYEKKEIVDEVKDATMVMLPKWHWFGSETAAGQSLNFGKAEEVIQSVDCVFQYMQSSFWNMGEYTQREVWSEVFWDYLSEWQTTVKKQTNTGKWTRDVLEMRLVSALTILRLVLRLKTLLANEAQLNLLCDCLLLRPDQDGQILPVCEVLNKHFDTPRNLVFPLLMLCKMLTVDGYALEAMTQHKWLFVIPLVHLLHGDAAIHEQVWDKYDAHHEKEEWWGIKYFPKYQKDFQSKMDGYKILNLDFLVNHLHPLFQVDYLLPRTLMCVLSLRHIKFAYAKDAFPLDCCIANCFYFIKSRSYLADEDDISLKDGSSTMSSDKQSEHQLQESDILEVDDVSLVRIVEKMEEALEEETGLGTERYKCSYCASSFSLKFTLQRHIAEHHECEYCDKTFLLKVCKMSHQCFSHPFEVLEEEKEEEEEKERRSKLQKREIERLRREEEFAGLREQIWEKEREGLSREQEAAVTRRELLEEEKARQDRLRLATEEKARQEFLRREQSRKAAKEMYHHMIECLNSVLEKAKKTYSTDKKTTMEQKDKALKEIIFVERLAWDLMKLLLRVTQLRGAWHRGRLMVPIGVQLIVSLLDAHYQMIDWIPKEQQDCIKMEKRNLEQSLEELKSSVVAYLFGVLTWPISNRWSEFADAVEPQLWSTLLKIEFALDKPRNMWRTALLQALENRIGEITHTQRVEMYCGKTDFGLYDPGIEETFSKVAFDVVSKEVNILTITGHNKDKYKSLVSRMFEEAWTKAVGADRDNILMHLLSWPSFVRCLEIFSTDKREILFNDVCIAHITMALSVLSNTKDRLLKHVISVSDFEVLLKHQESFITLCCVEAAREDDTKDPEAKKAKQESLRLYLTQFFQLRKHEVEYFRRTCDKLQVLLGHCDELPCKVHTKSLADVLREDNNKRAMIDIVAPARMPYEGKHVPKITLFGISDRVLGILGMVKTLSTSIILKELWLYFGRVEKEETGHDATQLPLQIDDAVERVWQPSWDKWSELVAMLSVGNTTLKQIDAYFGCFRKKLEDIKFELECMRDYVDTTLSVEEILKQIDLYYKLDGFTKGAVTILKVKKEMGLTGDFSRVETLANVTDQKHKPLRSMNKNLLTTGKILENITEKQVECLNAVAKCKELVIWLKGIGGTKELKVFVDLASTTAGEGDMDLDRVSMLHAVVTGYAPLICDLKPDATAEVFLDHCKMVWRALESDKELTRKLLDTKQHMTWLKFIKVSHGSVEVSSLSEVDAINGRGVYRVGNLKEGYKDIRDVILLTVPVLKDDPKRTYNFDQLNELQSKLMLMSSGKRGNQDDQDRHSQIDRFTEIFEGVTRLAKAYIKICSAGNILFQDWVSTLHCNWTVKNNVRVDFHLEKGILMEKNQGQLTHQIHNLANFMESCLQDWQDYLVKQRAKYPQLNHFTTAQIVLLRSEFAKVTGADVDNLTYNMLHSVKTNARREDLIGAVRAAHNFLEEKASPQKEKAEQIEEEMPEEPAENLLDLKETLMDAGYSEKLACLAIQEKIKNGYDEDECMVWCLENRDGIDNVDSDDDIDEDREGDVTMKDDDTEMMRDLDRLQPTTSMNSVTSELLKQLDRNEKALCDQLKELWDKFLGAVSMSVKDYRSVEHLGLILDRLSDREDRMILRTFPPFLRSGRPNLIVCPEADIYNMVLSLYLDDPQLPLPDDEEILLCTNTTTTEEVELLWQRATCDQMNQGKIYCLVNADRLDYDVSDSVEKSLEKHIKGKKDYRLVIVCSSEREDKSRMVTALDRDRCNSLIRPVKEISAYLKQQFKRDYPGDQSAPKLDYDNCSVRLVKSSTAGVGKTLIATRMSQALKPGATVGIPLHERYVTESDLVEKLIVRTQAGGRNVARLFHIDIGHDVVDGVDHVLFNLLVLRCIKDASGRCWRRSPADLYLIENLPLLKREVQRTNQTEKVQFVHRMLNILPSVTCRPPKETLKILRNEHKPEDFSRDDPLLHNDICTSQEFQRPYRYLKDLTLGQQDIPPFFWLELLLRYCGVENPSWAELRHFISFLNIQLQDCEHSIFCSDILKDDLPGFTPFVVNFMIQMSKDFATRSLKMSEETPQLQQDMTDEAMEEEEEEELPIALRRRWETSPHPYIFFNTDHHSITFLGFNIDKETGNLIDHQTRGVLKEKIMSKQLFDALNRQGVNLLENFDNLTRAEKIAKLCTVMGIEGDHDPDETYELTTDNVKKMLAIFMRFRCSIPVVVMGETGCGKTRLIKFMCDLQTQPGVDVKNMVLMKVHGGTSHEEVIAKVREAQTLAANNRLMFPRMDTILFFDEANTTEAIGLIKEIMCDLSMNGEHITTNTGLKFVAACNPYRKHSQEMIHNLEQAGLGYNVKADQTADKLGRVPMRQLVYRVQPLPQSMLPLVWDFGQLSDEVEKMYIRQIVQRYIEHGQLPDYPGLNGVITNILAASQDFMRQQKNECSFVSLRDVERSMDVMSWFFSQRKLLYKLMDGDDDEAVNKEVEDEEEKEEEDEVHQDDVTRSLILALGVCYHACLQEVTRVAYRDHIAGFFQPPCTLPNGSAADLLDEITRCQDVFLEQVKIMEPNIAPNQALKENLFMMVVCIELRIPLFLVGKPGSSKSLAKLIVTDAMQGETAKTPLFKALKQVHMVSFQCSPLATPDGIKGTFRQCARFQKDKNLDQFVSVVVLDEVGLAEDSPRMPLKTLHPLLEDGTCGNDDKPLPHKKVAFIGISNWALDPAKMNRGILVQRGVPDEEELRKSAEGICSTDLRVLTQIKSIIPHMAKAYLQLYNSALEIREFFGLRDFYSLVKMVYAFAARSRRPATWYQLEHAVRRNFGGLDNTDPVKVFAKHCNMLGHHERPGCHDPRCDPTGLIEACLFGNEAYKESRYLLILTENYAALGILQQHLLQMQDTIVIFGSSFRSDQEYTQVCRNINRIKKCMDTGKTVVLLNLESLYESLYDALNQYYVYMGGQRYVDLGLGTHRVKCRVDEKFRLIVVAEKDVVYEKFPIPLINRLEKHFLAMSTVLDQSQITVAKRVDKWATDFVTRTQQVMFGTRAPKQLTPGDVFCGYHSDTAASIVLQITKALGVPPDTPGWARDVYTKCKDILLACATPDSVLRLKNTRLETEERELVEKYFEDNKHRSLQDHVRYLLKEFEAEGDIFLEVTSRSHLLAKKDAKALGTFLKIRHWCLLALQAMDTKQQFSRELREFFDQDNDERVMLLQCDSGDQNSNLIACARYQIMEEYNKAYPTKKGRTHFIFIVQMPRVVAGTFVGFQGGKWHSVHLDDLRPPAGSQPSVISMKQQSISSLIHEAVERLDMPREEIGGHQETEMETEASLPAGSSTPMPMEMSESLDMEQIKLLGLDDLPRQPSAEELRQVMQMSMGRAQVAEGCGGTPEEDGGMSLSYQAPQPTRIFDGTQEVLDLDSLILACLQGAAAMIKDPDTVVADRPTRRLQILSKELSRQDGLSLMKAVQIRIAQLLTEKENAVMNQRLAQDWLSKDAAAPENINRAGTFTRAIQMVIEGKIMPTLAGLVAYLDTNSNLDILQRQGTARDKWIYTLWLKMLADVHVTPLSYKLLLSPKSQAELTEMIAQQMGAGRQTFQPLFPFSWEVYTQMEIIIQTAKTMKEEGLEQTCQRLFNNSPIGMFLKDFLNDKPVTVHDEMVDLYISDFIHMSVRCGQEGMQELLTKTLKAAFHETRLDLDAEGDDLYGQLTIPKLHLTFMRFHERFEHFIQACLVWKDCVAWLKKEPGHDLNATRTEMTLDVNILVKMVDYISSLDEKLKTPKGRQEWSDTAKAFKPVIDRILHSKCTIGPIGQQYMQQYKPLWMRICVIQLFIDHVCPPHIKEEAGRVDSIRPLWMFLGKEANFRTPKSLTRVAEFLRSCKFNAVKKFYKINSKCIACEEPMKDPVVLPCKHSICRTCFRDQMETDNRECLQCKAVIPEGFVPPERGANRKADESYSRYISACNEFFMDLVSQLCFAEDQPPTQEVIEILMSYVIHEPRGDKRVGARSRTKELTVYDECIDPSPVLRSLLLQLLLRYRSDDVREHLQYYFERSRRFLRDPRHIIELSLLCARCFEDSYHSYCGAQPGSALKTRVEFATRYLRMAEKDIGTNNLDIMKVEAIAKTRFGMSVAAEMMNKIHILNEENHDVHAARKLWEAARALHEASGSKWPRLFLVKQLCRNYGMESLDTVTQIRYLAWVMPDEARGREDNSVDRFILFGTQYQTIRDEVAAVVLGGSIEDFKRKCQELRGNNQMKEVSSLLALHREVYTHNLFEPDVAHRVADQTIDTIQKVCRNQAYIANKQAVDDILEKVKSNKIGPGPVQAEKMMKDIWDLLVQTTLVMQSLQETPLLKPFKLMMTQAGRMKDAYLPVMPHDHLEETRAALLAARRGTGDENPVFYSCSRGHPYVIGNCGRPAFVGRCWCGSDIGGQSHQLLAGNVKLEHRDNTQKGYVLGNADMRNFTPIPEREMSPAATTIVRLLLHLSMHIGTKSDLPGVAALIQPAIPNDQVRTFLLDHIRHDIQVLGRAINKSPDDCLTLMTMLIGTFMKNKRSNVRFNADLATKDARRDWEKAFTEAYVNPLLDGLDTILNDANALLVNDDRLSNNPLIKIVHEMISLGDRVDIDQIHDCHLMWQFRSRVTVEHLTQLMNEHAGDKCPAKILRQFILEEPHLRLLSRLPDIIRFQQLLIQRYQRRINQAEARTTKIKEILHDLNDKQRDEWVPLLENFTQAWNSVKDMLVNYSASGYTLPEEMCNMTVNPNTPIAMLIPSSWGLGLCSIMLVEYLTRRQNEFIMAYCRYRSKDSRELPTFGVSEATPAHLIYYDPEKDLLPMVLAHCNYSLEVGKGTVINYDFIGLERELEERLLRGKPKLVFDVAPMVFKTEYRNAMVIFGALRDNINQEPMSHAVQVEILRENRVFQDLCETIASLDITIAWLRDIGCEPETKLVTFMHDTLEMDKRILSQQIQQHCLLMHVQSLWLLLTMERSKQLKYFNQDAFEDVSEEYHQPLEGEATAAIQQALQHLNIDRFVSELYECILLNINIQRSPNEEDFQDNTEYSLADVMTEYISSKDGTEMPALNNGTFHKEVKVKHAVAVWTEAVKVQRKEEQIRRR